MGLEPATPQSQVEHTTTEPLFVCEWCLNNLQENIDAAFRRKHNISPTHFIELYDPGDLEIWIKVIKSWSFIKVLQLMYLCQLGKNLAVVCLFVLLLTSQVNSYGHGGTVSSPYHTFSWACLIKQLTSASCTYFHL